MDVQDLSPDLFARIDRVQAHTWRLELQHRTSPDKKVRDFGGPLGFIDLNQHNTLFNRTLAVGPRDAEKMAAVVAWYREHGIPPRIDVCPALRSPELDAALRALGLSPGGFPFFSRRVLAGTCDTNTDAVRSVTVRPAEPHERAAWHAILAAVWPGLGSSKDKGKGESEEPLPFAPGQRRYFACVDGAPVALASLQVFEKTGYLSLAATREAFRGRGCQTALLRRRIADSAEAGCDLITALVSPDSGSQRNMQRAGLIVACDRETWLPPDWTEHPFYRGRS